MRIAKPIMAALAGMAVLATTGCDLLGSEDTANEASPNGAAIRSVEPCQVLDDLQPIVDFMGILEITSGGGELTSAPYGKGLDAQAATCFGMTVVSEFDTIYDETNSNEGEISVGIIPWDTVEDAQLSYEERTGPDQERRTTLSESFAFTLEEELSSSDWDEGMLFVAEDRYGYYYDGYIRDGDWLLWVSIDFSIDKAIRYYESNKDFLDGPLEDYLSYEFTNDELEQWLVDEYIPDTHKVVTELLP